MFGEDKTLDPVGAQKKTPTLRILTPQSSGYFEDLNTPASYSVIQVETPPLEGPRILRGENKHTFF